MCDSSASSPDRTQKRIEPLFKFLACKPCRVQESEIVNASQFNLQTLEQFLRGVVQPRVAELHIKPLAGEFDRSVLSVSSEQ